MIYYSLNFAHLVMQEKSFFYLAESYVNPVNRHYYRHINMFVKKSVVSLQS